MLRGPAVTILTLGLLAALPSASSASSLLITQMLAPDAFRSQAGYLRDLVERRVEETEAYQVVPLSRLPELAEFRLAITPCGDRVCAFMQGTPAKAELVAVGKVQEEKAAYRVQMQLWNLAQDMVELNATVLVSKDLSNLEPAAHALARQLCRGAEPSVDPEIEAAPGLIASPRHGTPGYEWEARVSPVGDVNGHQFLAVPAGSYVRGSEGMDAESPEKPRHEVYLDAFEIARHETTREQFATFLRETGHLPRAADSNATFTYELSPSNLPVTQVSWHDAVAYCRWLSLRSGQHIALPTEAQWEIAARGHDERTYPWGSDFNPEVDRAFGNFVPDMSLVASGAWSLALKPVGGFPDGKSPFGVEDLAGNAAEWCLDSYDERAYNAKSYHNPAVTGYVGSDAMCLRGGGYNSSPSMVRSYRRASLPGKVRLEVVGFRVVRLGSPPNDSSQGTR